MEHAHLCLCIRTHKQSKLHEKLQQACSHDLETLCLISSLHNLILQKFLAGIHGQVQVVEAGVRLRQLWTLMGNITILATTMNTDFKRWVQETKSCLRNTKSSGDEIQYLCLGVHGSFGLKFPEYLEEPFCHLGSWAFVRVNSKLL